MVTAPIPIDQVAALRSRSSVLHGWLSRFSIEASPGQVRKAVGIDAWLPRGTEVYVPSLSAGGLEDRLAAVRDLIAAGHRPVPHVAARRLASLGELDETLGAYREAGIDHVLVIGGDPDRPAGPFASTLDVLGTGLLSRHGIRAIDVAGHPEGHVHADADGPDAALARKAACARASGIRLRVVTQFVFDAGPVIAWERRLRDRGLSVPIRVGLPGPATVRTLVSYALQCGVAASARMMAKRPGVTRLLGRWAPDQVIGDLADHGVAHPDTLIDGIHVFPFGGFRLAADWLTDSAVAARDGRG